MADWTVFIRLQVPQRNLKASMSPTVAHLNTIRRQDVPNDGDGDKHFSEMQVGKSCYVDVCSHFQLAWYESAIMHAWIFLGSKRSDSIVHTWSSA